MSEQASYERGEITRRGNRLFEQEIRQQLPADAEARKFVAIDVETGDFEVDESDVKAMDRLEGRNPDAEGRIFLRRVGSKSAYHFGGRLRLEGREAK